MDSESKFYGFSFAEANAGGLGAMLHALLLAAHYAKRNNLEFRLVSEGANIPRLNGSIDDLARKGIYEQHHWHTYFTSFTYVRRRQCIGVWTACPVGGGWTIDPPSGYGGSEATTEERLAWYSDILCNEIFLLQPAITEKIEAALAVSVFNADTDYALHVRRTDKVFKFERSHIESAVVPLEVYVEETMKVLEADRQANPAMASQLRVYLCTDDHDICEEMQRLFAVHSVSVVWDKENESAPRQADRMAGKMRKSEAWQENLHALKLLHILARARHTIGGRMSYFFRIAELLRYPSGKGSTNVKDSDIYGLAPYVHPSEPLMRPCKIDQKNAPEPPRH